MANWCSNSIVFNGDDNNVYGIYRLFEAIAKKDFDAIKAQVPSLAHKCITTFCGIELNGNTIAFETQWQPNIALLVDLAKVFQLTFILQYDECVQQFYGLAVFADEILTVVELPFSILHEYEIGKEDYNYKGMHFDFAYDLLDLIAEEKMKESLAASDWNPIHFS